MKYIITLFITFFLGPGSSVASYCPVSIGVFPNSNSSITCLEPLLVFQVNNLSPDITAFNRIKKSIGSMQLISSTGVIDIREVDSFNNTRNINYGNPRYCIFKPIEPLRTNTTYSYRFQDRQTWFWEQLNNYISCGNIKGDEHFNCKNYLQNYQFRTTQSAVPINTFIDKQPLQYCWYKSNNLIENVPAHIHSDASVYSGIYNIQLDHTYTKFPFAQLSLNTDNINTVLFSYPAKEGHLIGYEKCSLQNYRFDPSKSYQIEMQYIDQCGVMLDSKAKNDIRIHSTNECIPVVPRQK